MTIADTARMHRADLRERTKIAFRRAREDASLSQEQLARALDLSRTHVERWEDVHSDRPVPAWIEARMPESMLTHWRKHMNAMRNEERHARDLERSPESACMALAGGMGSAVAVITNKLMDGECDALERPEVLRALADVEGKCAAVRRAFGDDEDRGRVVQ